ncbi:multidrug efflux protein [compost metagenome]
MGLVIFTGITVGTVFTLFVVPMFYTFIAKKDVEGEFVPEQEEGGQPAPAQHH